MTVNQAFASFLNYGVTYWAPKTYKYYKKNVGYFMRYLQDELGYDLDQYALDDLRNTILFEYLVFLRFKQRYDNHPQYGDMNVDGVIRSNTVNSYMRAVKSFFNYLYNMNLTAVKYTEGLRLPKRDNDQIVVLTRTDVAKIDQVFHLDVPLDLRNYCIVHLMLDAGLRRSEVINLQVRDLYFDNASIVINRSKGDKSRVVIMCPGLAAMLQGYMSVFNPSRFLFSMKDGKPITDSVIDSIFRRISRSTSLYVHPHLLRHTFATSYIMGGGNMEMLRLLLGHYDYSVTRMYLHLAAQNQILHTDVYRLDPIFFKSEY